MSLSEYRKKRKPEQTPEPLGPDAPVPDTSSGVGAFVVHLHDATRRHFDVRIEIGGRLASFAVPKGPTLDPAEKHLAIHTEDHPLEYLDFEDVIPPGNYGAGPMIVWDRGSIRPLGGTPLEAQVDTDKVDFMLHGWKLRGRFSLVRIKKEDKAFLLLKKQDLFALPGSRIGDEQPESVLSGFRVDELEGREAHGASLVLEARALAGSRPRDATPAPEILSPLRAGTCPDDALLDPCLDGVRMLCVREGEVVRLETESAEDVTSFYPDIVRAALSMSPSAFCVEGTLTSVDQTGRPSVTRLAQRIQAVADGDENRALLEFPVQFAATDVRSVGDVDLRDVKVEVRRALLSKLVRGRGLFRALSPFRNHLAELRAFAEEQGLSGLVAHAVGEAGAGVFVPVGAMKEPKPAPAHARAAAPESVRGGGPRGVRAVRISNRDKIFWPASGLTKGHLVDYYAAVAPFLLPYLRDRPVILTRFPDGVGKKSFFQWNVPPGKPDYLETYVVPSDDGRTKRVFVIQETESLLYVVNLGCIPIHVLPFRVGDRTACDFLTIDFDVKASGLARAIPIAQTLRGILDGAGLPSYPKTSGQSGLHVLVPLRSVETGLGAPDKVARMLSQLLGHLLVRAHPDDATVARVIADRGDKVFVDTGQTGVSRSIAAPYAARATAEATVSMPISWDAVTPALDPKTYTLTSAPGILAQAGDPMQALLTDRVDLGRAAKALEQQVR